MSKWYEVTVTQVVVFVVEVEDHEGEDEAYEYALGETTNQGEKSAEAILVKGDRLETAKRHADDVAPLE